jgi:hypothetical protein
MSEEEKSKSEEVSEEVGEIVGKGLKKSAELVYSFAKGIGKGVNEDEEETTHLSSEISEINVEDPLKILKQRYARGEISIKEYKEMKKMLEEE